MDPKYRAPASSAAVPERTTTAQQALDRFHEDRLGRPAGRPMFYDPDEQDTGGVLFDGDPL